MNENKIHEQLSALVDDELANAEQTMLLHRLLSEEELRAKLMRYQLMHDAITHQLPAALDAKFLQRLSTQIAQEPVLAASAMLAVGAMKNNFSRILKPLSGAAIAASVALFSILGVRQLWQNTAVNHGVTDTHLATSQVTAKRRGMRWDLNQRDIENRLNSYMVNHNETTSGTNFNGIMQYFRMVGYDTDDNAQNAPNSTRNLK